MAFSLARTEFLKFSLPAKLSLFVLLALLCGCGARPEITSYTVTKDVPDRMLGAILLQDDRCWFFKLSGPREEVEKTQPAFENFLKSVEIKTEGPQWQLPEGWEIDDKPNKMRFATISVPLRDKPAELSVSFLPMQGDEQAFLAANINRWRDQMGQQRLGPQDWKLIQHVDTKSGPALVVNISGRLKGGAMTPPFAAGRG